MFRLNKLPMFFSRIQPKIDYSKDYYSILKLPYNAEQSQIRIQYYQLAKKYHPDSVTSNAEKYQNVQEAFKILSDLEYKQKYDIKRIKPVVEQKEQKVTQEALNKDDQSSKLPLENMTDCQMNLVIKYGDQQFDYEFQEKELSQRRRTEFDQAAFSMMRSFSINKDQANDQKVTPTSIAMRILEICALVATIIITKKK